MNPLDEYLELKKAASAGDLFRGAWQGLTGAVKPFAQEAQGNLFGAAKGAVSPSRIDALTRGYELGGKAQIPLAAGAVTGLALAVRKIHGAMTKQRDFKAMMALNPDLADAQAQRPEMFNQAYSSLRKMNPAFGSDPVVAGAFMNKMMIINPAQAGMILAEAAGMKGPAKRELSLGPLKLK